MSCQKLCLFVFVCLGTEGSRPLVSSRLATERKDAGGPGGARLHHRPSPFKVGTAEPWLRAMAGERAHGTSTWL